MTGVHENCALQARLVERLDGLTLEANAAVAPQYRLMLAPVPASQTAVTLADRRRNMANFITSGLTRMRGAAKRVESLGEKGPNEIGLESPGGAGPDRAIIAARQKYLAIWRLILI